ncbi:hypothetical protein BC833DRAFT_111897 [Globomyces pollinis-pini]|nr:hypothetical protein BC833DRAFT_111897 [Globomyces pollinis-pini]
MDLLNDLKTYPTIPRNDCKLLQIITAINQWLSVSNHASIARPFTAEIPSFCSAYFGNSKQNSLGFLHRNIPLADRNALVLLLDTNSLFISKLLALQSDSTLYHITPDYFPPTTQKLLQSADLSNLPAMYKNNITYKNSSSPKKDVKDTSELHQINFNIFEYYAFCFAYCPTLVLESNDNSLFNRFDPTKKSSIVLDSCYFDLLNSYLNYFCPRQPPTTKTTIVPETPKRNVGPFTPRTQPILQKPVIDVLDNSSIFQSPSIDSIPIALKNAHFVIESFIELWFCQNDYESFNVTSQSVPTYSKPNSYQMKCIGLFLNHLLSLNLQNITSEQVSRINTDRNAGQIGIIYDIHKANIYRCFSPKFYRFIALALQNWPTDDSITLIVDLWLDFAFPWKRINQYFSHEW